MKSIIQNLKLSLKKDLFIWFPVIIIPVLFTKKTLDPVLTIRFIALSGFLILFLLAILKKYQKAGLKNIKIKFNCLTVFVMLYILISGISLLYTKNISDGIFEFQKILLVATNIFCIVFYYRDPAEIIKSLLKSFVIVSSIILTIGIYQLNILVINDALSHKNMYLIPSVFAHKNIFSEILLILFPFTIAAFLLFNSFWKYLALTNTFLILFFITILMSRAVWIAFAVGFVLTFIIAIIIMLINRAIIFNGLIRKLILVGSVVLISVSIAIYFYARQDGAETLKKQTEKIVNFNYGSVKDRIELWKRSYRIFKENPVIGIGLGSWKIEILKYGNKNLYSEDQLTFYQRPHNDLIWIVNEQGIIGLFSYFLIVIAVFLYLIKVILKTNDQNEFIFYMLSFFALSGYLVFSFFSFPKERIEHGIFLSYIVGLILLSYNKVSGKHKQFNIRKIETFFYVIIVFLVFALITGINRFKAEMYTRNAFAARTNADWHKVITETEKAISFFYKMDPYTTPLAWYKGLAFYNLKMYDKALYEFKKANKINPYHIHVLNNLGTSYQLMNNHQQALKYYKETIVIAPNFEDALLNTSAVEYNLGNIDLAYNALKKISIDSKSNKYHQFIYRILNDKIQNLIIKVNEPELLHVINKIKKTNDWLFAIHKKCIENELSFEKQIIDDAIYSIEVLDSLISKQQANYLKVKYGNIIN